MFDSGNVCSVLKRLKVPMKKDVFLRAQTSELTSCVLVFLFFFAAYFHQIRFFLFPGLSRISSPASGFQGSVNRCLASNKITSSSQSPRLFRCSAKAGETSEFEFAHFRRQHAIAMCRIRFRKLNYQRRVNLLKAVIEKL